VELLDECVVSCRRIGDIEDLAAGARHNPISRDRERIVAIHRGGLAPREERHGDLKLGHHSTDRHVAAKGFDAILYDLIEDGIGDTQ
jgi:hypothetical protein